MSEEGWQPSSVNFMKACWAMGINRAFRRYLNPRGCADTKRFICTLKEKAVWVNIVIMEGGIKAWLLGRGK